ncbi:MAG: cyclic nucleotide-binding domain-containing protein, partial [Pseudomonadota bacterium]
KSLGLMLLVIFVVISLLFLNMKAGLLAIVPNLLPVVMLFGVMGFAGIPLDSGTSMIAAIALGICVDNTMHFMVRYNRELARRKDATRAIEATMRAEAMPITTATIALSLGLGVLIFSSFTPIACFGLLSSMVILLAYYANFFVTPILLSATRLTSLWDLLSIDLRRELINNCGLFQGMQPRQVKRVILMSEVRAYQAGETVMRRGEDGKELFVLLEGSGEIRTGSPGAGSDSVTPVRAGQVFGLAALLRGRPRRSTLVTLENQFGPFSDTRM